MSDRIVVRPDGGWEALRTDADEVLAEPVRHPEQRAKIVAPAGVRVDANYAQQLEQAQIDSVRLTKAKAKKFGWF